MDHDAPRTFSFCVHPGQIDRLDELVAAYRQRSEYVSRSALVRRALNLGLAALFEEEPDDDPNDGGPTATLGNEMVSATAH